VTGDVQTASVSLERNGFTLNLVRKLTGVLQDVVGMDDARGFISVVGLSMGEDLDAAYRTALSVDKLSREQVAEVLVDIKRRIEGDFFVLDETEDRLVLGNRACPFGQHVAGRPSLCMMTSNVFGHIAAQNLGYAAVELERTIAEGAPQCRIVIHLQPTGSPDRDVREYYER
jgi:predicted ArsR family transcriptional regulator